MSLGELTARKNIPIYVFFELTRHCNLRCVHCYVQKTKRPELSTAIIREIIDQLKSENSLILNFSGGEIFSRGDFLKLAWHARKRGFAIKMFTNGTLIDKDRAQEVADLSPLRVEITIFSLQAKIHDSITGVNGSLHKSLQALRFLHRKKVPLRIKSPLLKQNVSGYRGIVRLAKDLGVGYQFDPNIIPRTDGWSFPLNYRISKNDFLRVFSDPEISLDKNIDRLKRKGNAIVCSAGHNSCAISAYGDVFPCIILPLKLGNLTGQKFSQVWHSSFEAHKIRSIRLRHLKDCFRCKLLPYCNRCPGLAYLEDKDITGASSRACEIARVTSSVLRRSVKIPEEFGSPPGIFSQIGCQSS